MITQPKTFLRAIGLFLLISASLPSFSGSVLAAEADCRAFPGYAFWRTLTHERAISYVNREFKGDWQPYISYLQKQLSSLEKFARAGKAVRLKNSGKSVVLRGKKLEQYLRLSKARLDVVECLAQEQEAASLDNFATAAGDTKETEEDEPAETEVLRAPSVTAASRPVKLAISTSCSNGISKFKIRNQGPDWPTASAITIYRIEGIAKYPVSTRRMRLKKGQLVTFTVKKSRNPSGNLGLFVAPGWYPRSFAYDASLICL